MSKQKKCCSNAQKREFLKGRRKIQKQIKTLGRRVQDTIEQKVRYDRFG